MVRNHMRSLLKRMLPNSLIHYRKVFRDFRRIHKDESSYALWKKGHLIMTNNRINRLDDFVKQMSLCFKKVSIDTNVKYIYPYDSWVWREVPQAYKIICSITVDFEVVLNTDLRVLKKAFGTCSNSDFANRQVAMLKEIEFLADRIKKKLLKSDDDRAKVLCSYFTSMLYRKPLSLDEAIQKLLFYNALFWQANHWHIGLGRLDSILYDYYAHDLNSNIITKSQAKDMLVELVKVLGKDTLTKSKTLIGDTGQYILLGGIKEDGKTEENELTELFLEIFKEYKKPDPKLILRVNNETSNMIWDKAIACICNGNGSPLIMNEKPIMDNMKQFGYDSEDLYQVGTSACWEPLIIGKSFDQNNTFAPIMAYKPLNDIIKGNVNYTSFEDLLRDYKKNLSNHISTIIKDIDYDCSPLFTLFFEDCLKNEKDFTLGGAKYAYHGAQVLSFPNTINALLNIKENVFVKNVLTLEQCKDLIKSNFFTHEDMLELLRNGDSKYGKSNPEVVSLTNDLMTFIGKEIAKYKMNGKSVKVGFSSPNYIMSCNNTEATLDGRLANEPFAVHISPVSSNIDIAEILDFAAKLNYSGNRINGNIVDFTIPVAYLKNQNKLRDLIKHACSRGLFEVQLNVLSYNKLIDAKAHPEKYPELIVRVWGFSAFFNDLPEKYKDNLIERAKLYGVA